jgi:two-component system cell cycle response regulator
LDGLAESGLIEWAANFRDGHRRWLESREDVCLLDYPLGKRDGLKLLRSVRAEGCLTPVILLKADASEEVGHAAMEAGAADFGVALG